MLSYNLLLVLHACAVAATPVQSINVCAIQSAVINGLHQYTAASSFCSTFLGIKTSTITAVSTATPSPIVVTTPATNTAALVSITSTVSATVTVTSGSSVLVTPTSTATTTTTQTNVETCVSSATILGANPPLNRRNFPTSSSTSHTSSKSSSTTTSSTKSSTTSLPVKSTSCTIPAALSTFASGALSTACSCLSLPTPSVTSSSTVTLAPSTVTTAAVVTVTPTTTLFTTEISTATEVPVTTVTADPTTVTSTFTATATSLTATGLSYYYYQEQYSYQTQGYARVPAVVNSVSGNPNWQYTGTVQNINAIKAAVGQPITLPNSNNNVPNANFALVSQGYLYASAGAGTYTISLPRYTNDDVGLVWLGPNKAYGTQWNYNNADLVYTFNSGASTSVNLAAGEAYPIVIFYADVDEPAGADFKIITPDGTTHEDTSPFFVGACDGTALFTP